MSDDPFDGIDPRNGICASVVTFYAALYPTLRQIARGAGWALALHGSLGRDLDLVAIPWTDDAVPAGDLLMRLVEAAGGFTAGSAAHGMIEVKPHGRHAVVISLGGPGGMIDLSIMPRVRAAAVSCQVCDGRGELYLTPHLIGSGPTVCMVCLGRGNVPSG